MTDTVTALTPTADAYEQARNILRQHRTTAHEVDAEPRHVVRLHRALDPAAVADHVVALTNRVANVVHDLGFRTPTHRGDSHILVLECDTDPSLPGRLRAAGVRAAATDRRLRLGVHYFNDTSDVDRLVNVLATS